MDENNEDGIDYFVLKGLDQKSYIVDSRLGLIGDLMKFMQSVIYHDLLPPAYKNNRWVYGDKRLKHVSSVIDGYTKLRRYSSLYRSDLEFNPLLRFFFEQFRNHPICSCSLVGPNRLAIDGKKEGDVFGEFVAHLRQEAKKVDLKTAVRNWNSGQRKNLQRLQKFEKIMFERYSKLQFIRLDFNYHKALFTLDQVQAVIQEQDRDIALDYNLYWSDKDLPAPSVMAGRIALDEVLRDKDRLFANRRGKRSLFEHLVGYVWCVEFTPRAGYHLHVALFFNGQYVLKHEWLAQQIGGYFQSDISNGRAYFENCNIKRGRYGDDWALGPIDHRDEEKRAKLMHALNYLAKEDQRVHVKPHRRCHLFGAVILDRRRSLHTGRPRADQVNYTSKSKTKTLPDYSLANDFN